MGCQKLTYRSEAEILAHQRERSKAEILAYQRDSENFTSLKVVYNNLKMSEKGRIDCYRYGFNGMEKDDEMKGAGNSYTTYFRLLDPRLGRWLSLDPLARKFPWQSPYVAYNNNPIFFTDPLGSETPEESFNEISKQCNTEIRKSWAASFKMNKNGKESVRESGGLIIKRETKDGIEYKVINQRTSMSSDTYRTNYDDVPDGWEMAGDYHTHPYSEKELSKGWGKWDGNGMPHSEQDIIDLAQESKVKDGHVCIVEAGNKRFGIVITDKKALKYFVDKGGLNVVAEDCFDALHDAIDANSSNVGQVLWDSLVQGIADYEQETGRSAGIELFQTDVEDE